ncbi:mucin-5AC-like [Schistocerca serialis cubense]|uniref:mucin-5AC-like n=1 Tax=Schistocerca serialis cubense TaxID=2023355 RepID=UPI00214E32DA|nr:mucin-5AC-like [Schistocerca serialis cubense]
MSGRCDAEASGSRPLAVVEHRGTTSPTQSSSSDSPRRRHHQTQPARSTDHTGETSAPPRRTDVTRQPAFETPYTSRLVATLEPACGERQTATYDLGDATCATPVGVPPRFTPLSPSQSETRVWVTSLHGLGLHSGQSSSGERSAPSVWASECSLPGEPLSEPEAESSERIRCVCSDSDSPCDYSSPTPEGREVESEASPTGDATSSPTRTTPAPDSEPPGHYRDESGPPPQSRRAEAVGTQTADGGDAGLEPLLLARAADSAAIRGGVYILVSPARHLLRQEPGEGHVHHHCCCYAFGGPLEASWIVPETRPLGEWGREPYPDGSDGGPVDALVTRTISDLDVTAVVTRLWSKQAARLTSALSRVADSGRLFGASEDGEDRGGGRGGGPQVKWGSGGGGDDDDDTDGDALQTDPVQLHRPTGQGSPGPRESPTARQRQLTTKSTKSLPNDSDGAAVPPRCHCGQVGEPPTPGPPGSPDSAATTSDSKTPPTVEEAVDRRPYPVLLDVNTSYRVENSSVGGENARPPISPSNSAGKVSSDYEDIQISPHCPPTDYLSENSQECVHELKDAQYLETTSSEETAGSTKSVRETDERCGTDDDTEHCVPVSPEYCGGGNPVALPVLPQQFQVPRAGQYHDEQLEESRGPRVGSGSVQTCAASVPDETPGRLPYRSESAVGGAQTESSPAAAYSDTSDDDRVSPPLTYSERRERLQVKLARRIPVTSASTRTNTASSPNPGTGTTRDRTGRCEADPYRDDLAARSARGSTPSYPSSIGNTADGKLSPPPASASDDSSTAGVAVGAGDAAPLVRRRRQRTPAASDSDDTDDDGVRLSPADIERYRKLVLLHGAYRSPGGLPAACLA